MAANKVNIEQYIGYLRRKESGVKEKKSVSNTVAKIIAFAFLTIFCIIWMMPFILLVAGAVRNSYDGNTHPTILFGTEHGWSWQNFEILFTGRIPDDFSGSYSKMTNINIPLWILNSCISAIGGTALYLLVASMAAYAFTFTQWKFRNLIFTILIMSMVIPGTATAVGNQNTIYNTGMNTSLIALIIPGLGGVYGMYLIKTFFSSIPKDLIESAKMDGYSNFKIFTKIVLPLGKTVILVQGLFGFMGGWNDLIWPQMLFGSTKKSNLWTLQVGMAYIGRMNQGTNTVGIACASGIICILPVLIVYLFAQKYIIEGMAGAGIKK